MGLGWAARMASLGNQSHTHLLCKRMSATGACCQGHGTNMGSITDTSRSRLNDDLLTFADKGIFS